MPRLSRPQPSQHWDPRLTARALLSSRERGTVLLMVVGVLALLAIIGVVYATLGKSDRVSGATNVGKARASAQVEDVGGYLSSVIADAAFATYPELGGAGLPGVTPDQAQWIPRIRGYTLPLTDSHLLSVPPDGPTIGRTGRSLPPGSRIEEFSLFSPTGSYTNYTWSAWNNADTREYGDPYLATLEPEFLGLSPVINANPASLANRHDWRAISNFSPRGNFVNRNNLRPSRGGFHAKPGFAANNMSYGLTTFDPVTGHSYAVGNSKWPDIRPNGTVALVDANPLVPAHWSMNQVWAFRPAVADDGTAPGDYEYVFNQWADADGDGFLDSRWFEINDIGELFGNTPTARAMLSPRGRARILVAARCLDSSAMLNLNTASDSYYGPQSTTPNGPKLTRDSALPPGSSPAEINLRRLLTAADIGPNLILNAGLPANAVPYAGLPSPGSATSPDLAVADYSLTPNSYDMNAAFEVGGRGYTALLDARARASTEQSRIYPTGITARYPFQRTSGFSIFASPGHAGGFAVPGPAGTGYGSFGIQTPFDLADELELRAFFGVNDSDTLSRLEAAAGGRANIPGRPKYLDYSPLRDNRPRSLEMAGRDEFGPTDLFKNYLPNNAANPQRPVLLSVFSDIRHLLTTTSGAAPKKDGSVAPDSNPDGSPTPFTASTDISAALVAISNYTRFERPPNANDPVRYPNGTAQNPLDWRKPARDDYNNYKAAVQLIFRLYLNALAPYTAENVTTGLSPYPEVWPLANPSEDAYPGGTLEPYRLGLVYGGNAELAFRMAAHMTANLVDAFDRERRLNLDPVGTTLPNGTGRAYVDANGSENSGIDRTDNTGLSLQLTQQTVFDPLTGTQQLNTAYNDIKVCEPLLPNPPDPAATSRLAPRREQLSSNHAFSAAAVKPSGMMNIFGIEPQPFITEIASYFIYAADPTATPGGGGPGGPGNTFPPPGSGTSPFNTRQPGNQQQTITIKTAPDLTTNDDFVGEFIAVQLNNPFDQDVVLFDPRVGVVGETPGLGNANGESTRIDKFKFYLEYAGHYYVFARQKVSTVESEYTFADDTQANEDPVVLRAGETRTFYFTNPGSLAAFARRASTRSANGTNYTASMIENWIAGTWTNGKPEAASTTRGNGQLFLRDSYTISAGTTANDVADTDPSKPQPIIQVTDNVDFNPATLDAVQKYRLDLWGFDPNDSTGTNTIIPNTSDHAPQRRVAQLWRLRRSESTMLTVNGGDLIHGANEKKNDPTNDLLADRLRDHAGDMQDKVPDVATYSKEDTTQIADTRGSLYEPRAFLNEQPRQIQVQNSGATTLGGGLAIIAHGRITRPTDTQFDPATAPLNRIARGTARFDTSTTPDRRLGTIRGVLPPWCIEVRSDDDITWTTSSGDGTRTVASLFSLNKGESVPSRFAAGPAITPDPERPIPPALLTKSDLENPISYTDLPTVSNSADVYKAATAYDAGSPTLRPRTCFKSLDDMLSYNVPVNPEIAKPCEQKIGNDIHVNRDLRDYLDVAVEFHHVGEDRLGGPGYPVPEFDTVKTHILDTEVTRTVPVRRSRNAALFSRSGDFLLPLAVGPWFDPSRSALAQVGNFDWAGADQVIADREAQWMTLSESLALATGYYAPRDKRDPLYRFAQLDTTSAIKHYPRADRGHLAIDRFSPYMQKGAMTAQPLGSGVPFALGIVDQFRSVPGISSTPVANTLIKPNPPSPSPPLTAPYYPPSPQSQVSTYAFGGGTAARTGSLSSDPDSPGTLSLVPGTINLNTVTRDAMRTIPMLSPRQVEDDWMFNPNASDFNGYLTHPVVTSGPANPALIDSAANFYGLSGSIESYRNNTLRIPANAPANANQPILRSDQSASAIDYVRMARGIKSLGELGVINFHSIVGTAAGDLLPLASMFHYAAPEPAAVNGPLPSGGTLNPLPAAPRLSFHDEVASAGFYDRRPDGRIEDGQLRAWETAAPTPAQTARLSYDLTGTQLTHPVAASQPSFALQRLGSSQAVRPVVGPTGATTYQGNTYQDKLAILSSIAGAASVRSDIFTVYFLVHAYTPEDVDIPDDQPLVPSMAKRFVMVVDRSAVTSPGTKPKILMLKEVPMP